jgi:hypothetical protein
MSRGQKALRDIQRRAARSSAALSLEDTVSMKARGVKPRPAPSKGGFNPYDTGVSKAESAQSKKKTMTDLRKLSEWIKTQRHVAALKKDTEGDG